MALPIIPGIVSALFANGLKLIGDAVMAKGQDFVEEKLGVDLKSMVSTDEGRIRLAEIQAENESDLREYAIKKKEQELEADRMILKDKADARAMQQAALGQTDVFAKRFVYYFAIFWAIFCVIYIACITFMAIPEKNIRFADTILGFLLGTLISTIIQFFYGSSNSSKAKDDTVIEAVKGMTR